MIENKRKKVLVVFGTRPEAIKMAPLVHEFYAESSFNTLVCVTAQHREMLDQVLSIFKIKPDYDLNLMTKNQDLYDLTSRILLGMRDVLKKEKPDVVFVHGDTTTSMAASLAAFYEQIPVAHVEAGLRTNDKMNPWPEEMNRQLTGRIASFHFAPTVQARKNLLAEHVDPKQIAVTGNTIIDALLYVKQELAGNKELNKDIAQGLASAGYEVTDRKYVLVTGHRRENFGDGFKDICEGLKMFSERNPSVDIVYPVHLNPNVQQPVSEILSSSSNIYLIPPQEYLSFVYLMSHSYLIITDSGGIQEEAPSLGKPVLVMRETTERPEAVDAGTVKLVGTNPKKIVNEAEKLLNEETYRKMASSQNPYGDGNSSKKILDFYTTRLEGK